MFLAIPFFFPPSFQCVCPSCRHCTRCRPYRARRLFARPLPQDGVPYVIVKGKARLGTVVHKKTATVFAIQEVKGDWWTSVSWRLLSVPPRGICIFFLRYQNPNSLRSSVVPTNTMNPVVDGAEVIGPSVIDHTSTLYQTVSQAVVSCRYLLRKVWKNQWQR